MAMMFVHWGLSRKMSMLLAAVLLLVSPSIAFVPGSSQVPFSLSETVRSLENSRPIVVSRLISSEPRRRMGGPTTTTLHMFMGSDGGFLGIGAPELVTVLLVGYFVLGPSDLYKLTKEIGKFIQNARTLSADVTKTFETNLESQLEIEELRKAQRELNDAFSFRRSINVDEEGDPFSTQSSPSTSSAATEVPLDGDTTSSPEASGDAVKPKKKKRIRRRKVKKVPIENETVPTPTAEAGTINSNVPDLDISEVGEENRDPVVAGTVMDEETTAKVRQNRMKRLETDSPSGEELEGAEWLETPEWMNEEDMSDAQEPTAEETDRFAKQLSGNWNEQILANDDKLSPLAKVMEQLAVLEEEKNAADKRLEEEFRLRTELEEKYYQERRDILESAAAEVQANAYVSVEESNKGTKRV